MVSSQVKAKGPEDTEHRDYSCGGSPLPAEPPSDANIPNLPILTQKESGGSKAKNSCQTGGYKIFPKHCPERFITVMSLLGEIVLSWFVCTKTILKAVHHIRPSIRLRWFKMSPYFDSLCSYDIFTGFTHKHKNTAV